MKPIFLLAGAFILSASVLLYLKFDNYMTQYDDRITTLERKLEKIETQINQNSDK